MVTDEMEFKKQSPMLVARSHHASCYLNGYIYVLSGSGLRVSERFRDNIWHDLPKLRRARKSLSCATSKHLIYICDEREDSIEVFDTYNLTFSLHNLYGSSLTSKLLINHKESVIMFEHTYIYSKKGAALHTSGMYLQNGAKFNMDQFIIHWCNTIPINKDNMYYTCEDGAVWKHNLDKGVSKTMFTFQDFN
jgi:hypothetical protein